VAKKSDDDTLLKLGLFAAVAYFAWPTISPMLSGLTTSLSNLTSSLTAPLAAITPVVAPYSQAAIAACNGSGGDYDPDAQVCNCPPSAPNFNGTTCSSVGPIGVSGLGYRLRRNYRRIY